MYPARIFAVTCMLLLSCFASSAYALSSFASAKNHLPKIYQEMDQQLGLTTTIYCGCKLHYDTGAKWAIDLKECGYKVRKQPARAKQINVEHVMPAWEFGHQLKCWQEGGRQNCSKDQRFKEMEGELHNLYPSVGEVNGDRGNMQFSDWNAKPGMYGKCEMVVDFDRDLAQPPKRSRGMIARAYLFMSDQYGITLSKSQRQLYNAWNAQYAPDDEECLRNKLITDKQGYDNPYVTEKCGSKYSIDQSVIVYPSQNQGQSKGQSSTQVKDKASSNDTYPIKDSSLLYEITSLFDGVPFKEFLATLVAVVLFVFYRMKRKK